MRVGFVFLLLSWTSSGTTCAITSLTKDGVCNHSVGIIEKIRMGIAVSTHKDMGSIPISHTFFGPKSKEH